MRRGEPNDPPSTLQCHSRYVSVAVDRQSQTSGLEWTRLTIAVIHFRKLLSLDTRALDQGKAELVDVNSYGVIVITYDKGDQANGLLHRLSSCCNTTAAPILAPTSGDRNSETAIRRPVVAGLRRPARAAQRSADNMPRYCAIQSSSRRPSIRENSRVLCETKMTSRACA